MKMNMVQAINACLKQEMELNPKIVVLGEDVGVNGGVFRVTEGLYDKFGRERVIDTPLSEAGIIGVSIGMATAGLKPIPEIQFQGFDYNAYHHIQQHASKIRNRTRGKMSCPLVVRLPYSGGIRALEHHSDSLETIYIHLPGVYVIAPSSPYEAKGLLASAIECNDPVLYFEPKRLYRAFKEEVPEERYLIELGKANVLKEGEELTLISWGAMTYVCKEAIKDSNYSIEHIDLRTLNLCDWEAVITSVKKTGRALIVHEAVKTLGFGAEITSRIQEEAFYHLEAPVKRVTAWDINIPLPALEDYYFPDKKRILKAINEIMEVKE